MRLFAVKTAFCCWAFYDFAEAAARTHPFRSGESGGRLLTPNIDSDAHLIEGNERVDVRHGVLFQTNGCPQAITSARAQDIWDNTAFKGNTIRLQSQTNGRTGNHFEDLSQLFSMAYCCRSSLFVLPETDITMPSEDGRIWKSAHPWYDFSDAKMDLLPEFAKLSDRPDVCYPNRVASGPDSYRLVGVHPHLLECLNHVFVRGCEAHYLGSVVNTTDFCHSTGDQMETFSTKDMNAVDAGTGSSQSAGSLVIHIRSGDIFNPRGEGGRRPTFGQPPLQFFLDVIGSKAWSDVSVISSYKRHKEMNPTYGALKLLNDAGLLGQNVTLHHDRDLLDDLKALLCADALAVARSSLHFLTFAHTTASTFYLPGSCGPGTHLRRTQRRYDRRPKDTPDNATLLILEKPQAEVYGIDWGNAKRSYTPYERWSDSDEQLLEMVTFDGIKRLKRCSITD